MNQSHAYPLTPFTRQQYYQVFKLCLEIVQDPAETRRRKAKAQKIAMLIELAIGPLSTPPARDWGFYTGSKEVPQDLVKKL